MAPFLALGAGKGAIMYLGPRSVKASLRDPESLKEAFTDLRAALKRPEEPPAPAKNPKSPE